MAKEIEIIKKVNTNQQNIKNPYHEQGEIQNQINQITIINDYLNEALNDTLQESTKQNIKQMKELHLKLQKKLNNKIK